MHGKQRMTLAYINNALAQQQLTNWGFLLRICEEKAVGNY